MAQKLYYEDAHQAQFSAVVLSCEKQGSLYEIVLDKTAFYPEGGGQPGDTGLLGGVRVTDTQERGDEIIHLCDAPLALGRCVDGCIDWMRRFDFMQQHSGEHIVSGIINRLFGYDNVGFHMGADCITIDFNGMLDADQLAEVEREANEKIWQNVPIEILWPDEKELPHIGYRSKKELTGAVRIVRIDGADVCACCGTHVKMTGEIGIIKLLSVQKFHEGARIEMLCGRKAYAYLSEVAEQNKKISGMLSAPAQKTAQAAERVMGELAQTKNRAAMLERRLVSERVEKMAGCGNVLLFEQGLGSEALRELADGCAEVCGGRVALFSGTDADGYRYIIAQRGGDLRELAKTLNDTLQGRGGGKPAFVQGSVQATRAQIEACFTENL